MIVVCTDPPPGMGRIHPPEGYEDTEWVRLHETLEVAADCGFHSWDIDITAAEAMRLGGNPQEHYRRIVGRDAKMVQRTLVLAGVPHIWWYDGPIFGAFAINLLGNVFENATPYVTARHVRAVLSEVPWPTLLAAFALGGFPAAKALVNQTLRQKGYEVG